MTEITLERMNELMNHFRAGYKLPYFYVVLVIEKMIEALQSVPNVQQVKIPTNGRLTVVGDTHGQIEDVLHIFKINGIPSEAK